MKDQLVIIAGPCAVESKEQILGIAGKLKGLGVEFLRGGAFKPRTSPNSFQGLENRGLEYLKLAKEKTGLKIVTEIMGPEEIGAVSEVADILQVGSRSMDNYDLLKKIGKRIPEKPVLLKRGFSATKKELLGAISYLKTYGHRGEVMVCERGIRTFANGEYDRFTLDVGIIADLKKDKNFNHKVIVDPSHPAGRKEIVGNLACAGIAAGADGLLIEVKLSDDYIPRSDAAQAITISSLQEVLVRCEKIYEIVRRESYE